jgi:phosphate transport system substrate-binding protein
MTFKFSIAIVPIVAVVATLSTPVMARDQISIVGSSTVYPFATMVAERFGRQGKFKTPKVEATGTGGGMKLFCSGVGPNFPDIVNASRRIKASEVKQCQESGINQIVEIKIGYDGIVLAHSKARAQFPIALKDLYLGLAASYPNGKKNSYKNWSQISKSLPNEKIEVIGPPPTSGTRDAFNELMMEAGCVAAFPSVAPLKKTNEAEYKKVCTKIREDGGYVEAGENDNLIVQKLIANPNAIGVFGYSFLEANQDKITGSPINGVEINYDNIASGKYPVSRPLYFYVKRAHVGAIAGLREFLSEFSKEATWGPDGYLADRGLVAMPTAERQLNAGSAKMLTALDTKTIK